MINFSIAAHRGGIWNNTNTCSPYPENTLTPLENSLKAGFGIEFDILLTKDNNIVIFHDDEVDHLTNGSGKVEDYTLKDLQDLTFKSDSNNTKSFIPTLEQLVNIINKLEPKNINYPINIEIKANNKEIIPPLICQINKIKNDEVKQKILVSSFNHPILLILQQRKVDFIKLGALFTNSSDSDSNKNDKSFTKAATLSNITSCVRDGYNSINILWNNLDQEIIDVCKKNNVNIVLWTSKEPLPKKEDFLIKQLLKWQDSISCLITDYPLEVKNILDEEIK